MQLIVAYKIGDPVSIRMDKRQKKLDRHRLQGIAMTCHEDELPWISIDYHGPHLDLTFSSPIQTF